MNSCPAFGVNGFEQNRQYHSDVSALGKSSSRSSLRRMHTIPEAMMMALIRAKSSKS